jgi:ribosome-binding protein aMBF1 (putative translation factor)
MADKYLDQLNHQDWNTIIIKKDNKTNITNNNKKISNESLKNISIEKKAESGDLSIKKISLELRQTIQKARCAKSLTQKQLSNNINLNVQIISDIESGKALYNARDINKIVRYLKIKIPKLI